MNDTTRNAALTSDQAEESAARRRFRVVGNIVYLSSLICHAAMILGFNQIDQSFLSVFNIGSVIVIGLAVVAHRRGSFAFGYMLFSLEIVAHAVATTLILGWETGFFIHMTFPMMIMPFLPDIKERVKLLIGLAVFAMMIVLLSLAVSHPMNTEIGDGLEHGLLIVNILLMTSITGLFMFLFSKAIDSVEAKLVEVNQHLKSFSSAVSQFLDPMLVDKLNQGEDVSPRTVPLTVLFSDLAASTRLSQAMDDQAYGAMIDEYAGTMHAIIKRHSGFVEDISGDGILAYIGNMESRGEAADAIAVVEMAIEMQETLNKLNPRFMEEFGLTEPLRARIGISSGAGFVGKSSGVRSIYTANGASVNLGAKLEQGLKTLTDQGGILISEATASLIGSQVPMKKHRLTIGENTVAAFLLDTGNNS